MDAKDRFLILFTLVEGWETMEDLGKSTETQKMDFLTILFLTSDGKHANIMWGLYNRVASITSQS